jgi:hypothetical protein
MAESWAFGGTTAVVAVVYEHKLTVAVVFYDNELRVSKGIDLNVFYCFEKWRSGKMEKWAKRCFPPE